MKQQGRQDHRLQLGHEERGVERRESNAGRLRHHAVGGGDPARVASQLVKPEQREAAPERSAGEPGGERPRLESILGEDIVRQRPQPHVASVRLAERFEMRREIGAQGDSAGPGERERDVDEHVMW
jgi:hypothetical protein